jgi:putative NIF3 family GTP cyclohydrolase 1 type 2
LKQQVLNGLKAAHPYEEVPYGFYTILNERKDVGFGAIGKLPKPMHHDEFLNHLASSLALRVIRATKSREEPIQTVAVCGGSGAFLIEQALANGADAYITGDLKYHDFFETRNMLLVDIGHYESEVGTSAPLAELINKKFPTLTRISEVRTSPIYHHIF